MADVLALARRVEAQDRAERDAVRRDRDLARLAVLDAGDRELLAAGQAERLAALAGEVLQRQDPHHQQVRAVDPLVALGDHGLDAEQVRPLRGPVARRAGAVLLAGQHDRRRALGEVALGRGEDRHLLAVGQVRRPRALRAGHELVAQAHVRERAAHHHLVVAAPRAVRVEVGALDAVLDEVGAGRRVELDRAGGRDVVGRDRVADRDEAAGAVDVGDRAGGGGHAVEVRRPAHVGRGVLPVEQLAGRAPAARARRPRPRRRWRRCRGTSRARSRPPSSPAPRPARARCRRGRRARRCAGRGRAARS